MSMNILFFIGGVVSTLLILLLKKKMRRLENPVRELPAKEDFLKILEMELERLKRRAEVFSVACLETFEKDDVLLKAAAKTLKENIRCIDYVGQVDGVFVFFLRETDSKHAFELFQRLLKRLYPSTFSVGITTFLKPPQSVEEMLKKTGELLYLAKKKGKNTIEQGSLE